VHADPAADYLPVALALGASVRLKSSRGERTVAARDFFQGIMTTAIDDGELLVEIEVPKQPAGAGSSYQRLHRVEGNYAIVAAAALVELGWKSARNGLGGVGPTPVLVDVTAHLAGGPNDAALERVAAAASAAAGDAFGDLNGDAAYKQAMAGVYAKRVVRAAAARLG
jgi:carbon-monoxide dehydrogenase medium subunit